QRRKPVMGHVRVHVPEPWDQELVRAIHEVRVNGDSDLVRAAKGDNLTAFDDDRPVGLWLRTGHINHGDMGNDQGARLTGRLFTRFSLSQAGERSKKA